MKSFKEFNNKSIKESNDINPIDKMIEELNKTKYADNFSIRSYQDIHKDGRPEVYEISAEISLANRYKKIETFSENFDKLRKFMEENFNYYDTEVGCYTRTGSIGFSFKMTLEELESSKAFKPYKTIVKYNL